MNKLIITLSFAVAVLITPQVAYAQYGQQVLGEKKEEVVVVHKTVDTAISDFINPSILGSGSVVLSGALYFISKKLKAQI